MSRTREFDLQPEMDLILDVLAAKTIRSRKSVQKLMYFLQEGEGVPLGLDYRMYYYGPYSPELDSKLEVLSLLGLLSVSEDHNGVPTYEVREDKLGVRRETGYNDHIQRVVRTFGKRSANDLELLSTIHLLAQGQPGADEDELFRRLLAWKGSKFSRKAFDDALEYLRRAGYL